MIGTRKSGTRQAKQTYMHKFTDMYRFTNRKYRNQIEWREIWVCVNLPSSSRCNEVLLLISSIQRRSISNFVCNYIDQKKKMPCSYAVWERQLLGHFFGFKGIGFPGFVLLNFFIKILYNLIYLEESNYFEIN